MPYGARGERRADTRRCSGLRLQPLVVATEPATGGARLGSSAGAMVRSLRLFVTAAKIVMLATLAVTLGATSAWPQPSALAEREFRVEWERRETSRGSAIAGYVYNNATGMTASKVRVLVDGVDASGRAVNSTVAYVLGTVPAFTRTYFEVRVPEAASYRVSVLSFEWLRGGAGGGM
jgi:hypothetical protein